MSYILDDLKYKSVCYYGSDTSRSILKIMRTDGTSAMILYRINQFLVRNKLGAFAIIFRYMNRALNSCWIGKNAEFGKGFVIMHPYGIVINSNIRAGENIIVQSGVVIGVSGSGSGSAMPVLGNNIYIGSGAKILGGIRIGDNVKIGANAVVLSDVPDNATVVGIPGVVKKIETK